MRSDDLLRSFIQELVIEVSKNPRVANQLRSAKSSKSEETEEKRDENEVDEMNVTANIVGPILPLGMSTSGEKKEPGWS